MSNWDRGPLARDGVDTASQSLVRSQATENVVGRLGSRVCARERALARRGRVLCRDEMIDAMIDKIRALDLEREYRALATHVVVTSPSAVETLARARGHSPSHEALRIAAMQLRVVHDLGCKLRWLECACRDASIDPGVRNGLTAVLRSVTNMSELLPVIDSQAAVLLEPALLFHRLLARMQPWLPHSWATSALPLEGDEVLEQLQLGIPDYLHPVLQQRLEALWQQFQHLRQQPHPPSFNRLSRVSVPRMREWYESGELTG